MNIELARFLREASEQSGNECDIREEYYGRNMRDNHTTGVVVDSVALLLADVIQYISEHVTEDEEGNLVSWDGINPTVFGEMSSFRVDNMGNQVIIY